MASTPPSTPAENPGATVVITHRVRDGQIPNYENWLNEIGPLCRAAPGHLDWHIVRPIAGLTDTFTVIIRFDSRANLQAWMESPEREGMVAKVQPFLVAKDNYAISSGLDFWFAPASGGAKVPVRWKQYLVSWSAIYPLVLGLSWAVGPLFQKLGLPNNRYLATLVVTGSVVFLMVYVVMPRYTRLVQKWLYR